MLSYGAWVRTYAALLDLFARSSSVLVRNMWFRIIISFLCLQVTFGNQIGVPEAKKLLKQCYDAGVNLCA